MSFVSLKGEKERELAYLPFQDDGRFPLMRSVVTPPPHLRVPGNLRRFLFFSIVDVDFFGLVRSALHSRVPIRCARSTQALMRGICCQVALPRYGIAVVNRTARTTPTPDGEVPHWYFAHGPQKVPR